jgi:hypothetical protein
MPLVIDYPATGAVQNINTIFLFTFNSKSVGEFEAELALQSPLGLGA